MSRSRILFFLVSAVLVFPLLAATLVRAATTPVKPEDDSFYKYLSVFSETLGLVRQGCVDEPDMNTLMTSALDGTTDALDPFSLYVPASAISTYNQAAGIGRRYSGLTLLKERGIAYVVAVEKGSPGGLAKIRPGDVVAKINGRSTRLMPLWEMQQALTEKPGTKVNLEVIRLGEPVQISFELKAFDPPPVSLEDVEGGVTLLHIPSFDKETVQEVRDALDKNRGKIRDRLLIDLRGVSSGDPEVAYATARLFTSGDLGALMRRSEQLQAFH